MINKISKDHFASRWGAMIVVLALGAWLTFLAVQLWERAAVEVEPPVYDGLNYVQKGKGVWEAVNAGQFDKLFAVEPSFRPPGTVLVTYPAGFEKEFAGVLFRTLFIPAALIVVAAVLVAAPIGFERRALSSTIALAIGLSAPPPIFQLQYSGHLPAAGYWGLVDCFLAGLAAMAAACVYQTLRRPSAGWLLGAAGFAILAFWTKPAGLIVMLVVATFSALIAIEKAWALKKVPWPEVAACAGVVAIFGIAVGITAWTAYFSVENLGFGAKVMNVMHRDLSSPVTLGKVAGRMHIGVGWPVLMIFGLGVGATLRYRDDVVAIIAGTVALIVGALFWLVSTDLSQVRYFLPFTTMAGVMSVPVILKWSRNWGRGARAALTLLVSLPAVGSALLMLHPDPPVSVQRVLGISLVSGETAPEVTLGRQLIEKARERGSGEQTLYLCSVNPGLRGVQAVIDYERVVNGGTGLVVRVPIDWVRGFAVRLDEVVASRFIGCELPASGEVAPEQLRRFEDEQQALRIWLSNVDEASAGIRKYTTGRIVVVEVINESKFENAVAKLWERHGWRDIAEKGYTRRSRSRQDLVEAGSGTMERNGGAVFRTAAGQAYGRIVGLSVEKEAQDLIVDVWFEAHALALSHEFSGWRLFVHGISKEAGVLLATETAVRRASEQGRIMQYQVRLAGAEGKIDGIAVGFYEPGTARQGSGFGPGFLITFEGRTDWGGRRLLMSYPGDVLKEMAPSQ